MLGLAHRGFALHDYTQHITHTLRNVGYHSALCGVQHIATRQGPEQIGYDQILETSGNRAPQVAPTAVKFLHEAPQQPFFLSVGFSETHRTFPEPAPADDPRHVKPPAPLPDTPEVRRDMAGYNTLAHQLDDGMGQVLAALDATGLAENTLVIITTDHGIAFPHMKCNLTDHGTGVMLMMRGPTGAGDRFEGGNVIDAMVTHLDLYPTCCDVADAEKPEGLQGKSLLPLMRGEVDKLHDEVFAEVNFHAAYEPKRSVRTERYKYIRRFDGRTKPVRPNCDGGYSKELFVRNGWADAKVEAESLFDLIFDPNEANNLAERADMADVLNDMRSRLQNWMKQTNDPLLDGPLMMHAGVRINPPDGDEPGATETELIETPRLAP